MMRSARWIGVAVFLPLVFTIGALGQSSDGEANFSKEQLEEYYKVYSDAEVLHIRAVIDSFLAHKPLSAIESGALSNISTDYLKSKFVVLANETHLGGGRNITIIFQDKPDKVFSVWLYKKVEKWELRDFRVNDGFGNEEIQRIKTRYRVFLADKKHAG
jgi:hypothetical protein